MNEILLTGIVGILTAAIGSLVTYLTQKKKYKAESDDIIIRNMKEAMDFYDQYATSTRNRFNEIVDMNKDLMVELGGVKAEIGRLADWLCTVPCQDRHVDPNIIDCVYLQDHIKPKRIKSSKS